MNTTVQKPSTRAAMQQAARVTTPAGTRNGCPDCVKSGLAILPVVPFPLPLELRGRNPELQSLDNRLDTGELKAHWMALRALPAGYLYVLKPDDTWDCYLVDRDGMLRLTPVGLAPVDAAAQAPMSDLCKRHGDNIPAQVIAIDPNRHAAVWLAFSRYRWTGAVLDAYAANKGGCRDQRMTKLDVMAAAAGSLGASSKAKNAVRFGAPMSARVADYVADYSSSATQALINAAVATALHARSGQGAALAAKMAEISKHTSGKTGAIIALGDGLGIAQELNAIRNAETGKLMAYLAENQRKRFVGEVILGFEKAFVENGQGAEWTKRYKPKYKANQIKSDRQAFDSRAKPWEARINVMSDDVARMNAPAALRPYWRDFDGQDHQSAKDRQRATAACLNGAVKTPAEQALWDEWFKEDPRDPAATLWGAATALQPKLADYLWGKELPDAGKSDKLSDIAKNLREAKNSFREEMAKRSSDEALALIGTAMASQLARVKFNNPSLYKVAGWRVLAVASARTTVMVAPTFIAATEHQLGFLLAEAAFGPPVATAKRLLDIELTSSRRVYVVGTNGVDAYTSLATQTTSQRVRAVELWLPDELAKQMPALSAPSRLLALPPPKVNPFKALIGYSKTLPAGFAWVGLTLQVLNLGNSAKDAADAKVQDKTDAYFGIASGVLGVLGVTAEIAAGTMGKMAGQYAVTRVAQIAFAGGVLASLSATAEGIQSAVKAVQRYSAGDTDAADWYAGSSIAFLFSGAAALGGSLAVASTAGALTGVLSILAGAGASAAVVPVWGWIAASVLFLGAGLVMLWQAIKETDTPLEVWLLGCTYGNGAKRLGSHEEMDGINDVMFAIKIEVEWSGDAWEFRKVNFYDDYDDFKFRISLPGAGAESVIDCKVVLVGPRSRKEIFHETIRPRMLGSRVADPHIATIGPASSSRSESPPSFVWFEPPHIGSDGRSYGGHLKIDDDIFMQAEVEVQYWPNQRGMPSLVLPKAVEQRTLIGTK